VVHSVESSRHWIVRCLGCRNPIVLCTESVETRTGLEEAKVSRWKERGFLRAWCNSCSREYPYRSSDIECVPGLPSESERPSLQSARNFRVARSAKA
jgi:hypothetical protein